MGHKIYISIVLFATLFLSFNIFTSPIQIYGHLKKNPKDKSAYIKNVSIFVKANNKILAVTTTDNKGDFEMTFTPEKEKSFDFYACGLGIDTILIASYKYFESDVTNINFYIPGIRKRNSLGKTICPICKKSDKVYKIVYGDGIFISHSNDNTVDKINNNPKIVDGHYYAGTCIVGISKYYCDREKVEF